MRARVGQYTPQSVTGAETRNMNHPDPSHRPHLPHQVIRSQPSRIAARLAIAAALALPAAAFAQQAPTGGDDNDAAMRNIQNNFAHMAQPPRTIDTINQELKQTSRARGGGGGGGMGQRGGGRHGGGRQASQQQDKSDSGGTPVPGTSATPPESSALSGGTAPQ